MVVERAVAVAVAESLLLEARALPEGNLQHPVVPNLVLQEVKAAGTIKATRPMVADTAVVPLQDTRPARNPH